MTQWHTKDKSKLDAKGCKRLAIALLKETLVESRAMFRRDKNGDWAWCRYDVWVEANRFFLLGRYHFWCALAGANEEVYRQAYLDQIPWKTTRTRAGESREERSYAGESREERSYAGESRKERSYGR